MVKVASLDEMLFAEMPGGREKNSMHRSPRVRNLQTGASSLGLEQHAWMYKHSEQDCVAVVGGISEVPEGRCPAMWLQVAA